ncbi:MAG: hypothetical protein ACO1QS_13800 [Verrucomicrobiota bacterium]
MQGVMNYPAWKLIGAAEFPAFHQSVDSRIFLFYVPIFFLSVPISILMLWFGHPAISRRLLFPMALINLFIFIITVAVAIPIQSQLAEVQSIELIDRLIFFDRYFRNLPGLLGLFLTAAMLHQILRRATANAQPAAS